MPLSCRFAGATRLVRRCFAAPAGTPLTGIPPLPSLPDDAGTADPIDRVTFVRREHAPSNAGSRFSLESMHFRLAGSHHALQPTPMPRRQVIEQALAPHLEPWCHALEAATGGTIVTLRGTLVRRPCSALQPSGMVERLDGAIARFVAEEIPRETWEGLRTERLEVLVDLRTPASSAWAALGPLFQHPSVGIRLLPAFSCDTLEGLHFGAFFARARALLRRQAWRHGALFTRVDDLTLGFAIERPSAHDFAAACRRRTHDTRRR